MLGGSEKIEVTCAAQHPTHSQRARMNGPPRARAAGDLILVRESETIRCSGQSREEAKITSFELPPYVAGVLPSLGVRFPVRTGVAVASSKFLICGIHVLPFLVEVMECAVDYF